MPYPLYIPSQVLDAISKHIADAVERAVDGFWSANEDEDTLTGHLGACLKIGVQTVHVTGDEINGPWKWSIDYAKFRGRGKNATESFLGADGIFELSLDHGFRTETKSLLFQSKTDWQSSPDLVEQSLVLSNWREAAIAVNYTPISFDAYSIDSVIASQGEKARAKDGLPLAVALGDYFIRCKIGNTELRYDARARRLYWRDINGLLVAVQFSIPQRIRLLVEAPARKNMQYVDKEILPEEVHQHRMAVDAEEVLTPILTTQNSDSKKVRRGLAMAYHPDRFANFSQFVRDIANHRMQEVNSASDEVDKRKRRGD